MRRALALVLFLLPCWLTFGCASSAAAKPKAAAQLPKGAQGLSLFGEPLYPPVLPPDVRQRREIMFSQSEIAWQTRPESAEAQLAMARRLIDLARYGEALAVFDQGVEKHPTSPFFPRFRAECNLALRRFDKVMPDVEKGLALLAASPDSMERDTLPNALNVPTTSIKSNLHSLAGFARFAQGDLAGAAAAFRNALEFTRVHDAEAATRLWLYLALALDGKTGEATKLLEPVNAAWELYGDAAALRLLVFFRDSPAGGEASLLAEARAGKLDADVVESALGLWHLARGERPQGVDLLRRVVARGNWPAPAAIVAEARLASLGEKPKARRS